MRILITGSNGFIGRNLISELKNRKFNDLYLYDMDSTLEDLDAYCREADFVYHLAGVNRPEKQEDFMLGNFGFTSKLLELLKKHKNQCPIMLSSSIQAVLDNPYGQSKKAGEDLLFDFGKQNNSEIYAFRFPNVFGKWSRPNYNSAVATFCYNIARDIPITVNNRDTNLSLVYIDDVVEALIGLLSGDIHKDGSFCSVQTVHTITLGHLVDHLYSFKKSRENFHVVNMGDPLVKKLYSTYLSFLPEDQFSYPLKMNVDARGSFTEVLKTVNFGQVSINVAKPGIVKGNHWHHTKNEKFLVVSGQAVIRFRNISDNNIIEYFVNSEKLEVVDIPCGYTHNIENVGNTDLVTLMWANEHLDPNKPDTFFLEV